jgi:hypothetical protein
MSNGAGHVQRGGARMCVRAVACTARGSLRSGRGTGGACVREARCARDGVGRGRLAPCRGPLEGARVGGRPGGKRLPRGTTRATGPLIRPARGHPARTDARWASVPGTRRPRPTPYLRCRD